MRTKEQERKLDDMTDIIYQWLLDNQDDFTDGYNWYLMCAEEDVAELLQLRCRNLAKRISHMEAVDVDNQRRALSQVQGDGAGQDGQPPHSI
jgi:hypothetical protein